MEKTKFRISWSHYRRCKKNPIIKSYVNESGYEFDLFPDDYTNIDIRFGNLLYSYFSFIKALLKNSKGIHIVSHPIFLVPVILLKKITNCIVVYYPFEIFGHQSTNKRFFGKFLAAIWFYLEAITISKCNLLITQNKYRRDYYFSKYDYTGRVLELPNIKKNMSLCVTKKDLGPIFIVYAGLITNSRFIKEFIQSLEYLSKEYSLILCGKSELEDNYLRDKISEFSGRLIHLGEFGVDEVIRLNKQVRIGFLAYENNSLNNSYAAPSKVFDYIQNYLVICSNVNLGIEQLVPSELIEFFDEKSSDVSKSIAISITRANQKSLSSGVDVFDSFLQKYNFETNLVNFQKEIKLLSNAIRVR